MKKSIFIKDNKYYSCNDTTKLPQHIIYCEMLGFSVENFFENEISTMDVYVDFNSNLKKFYEYLEEDKKRNKIKKILNSIDDIRLNKSEFINLYDKNSYDVFKLYRECVEVIKSKCSNDYIDFFSKRNERYLDKESFGFCNGFRENKKYLIPIVDRLNEIQIHKISEDKDKMKQILEIVSLYDDYETLFSFNIATYSEFYEFSEVDFLKQLLEKNIEGIIRIVCDEDQFEKVINLLYGYEINSDIMDNSNIYSINKFKEGDEVTFLKLSSRQFRITQIYGKVKRIEEAKIWVETNKGEIVLDMPARCLIKTKIYNETSSIESPINWYGGKYYLANDIINIFPKNEKKYVEVFGGAGHILFKKGLAVKENVYNDLNVGLSTFFKILSDKKKRSKLMNKLTLTPYHQAVWEESELWEAEKNEIELARKFYVRTMQSRSSNGGWSFTRDKKYSRRSLAASASKWLGNIENNIHRSVEKLSNFSVEGESFEICIEKHDSKDTLFYLDPPYVPDTRTLKKGYKYEMSVEQHEQLVDVLLNVKGKVVLSGYNNNIYSRLEREGKFTRILIKEVVKSSVNVNREEFTAKEYVWINYKIEDHNIINFILREILCFEIPNKRMTKSAITLIQKKLQYIFPLDYYNFLYNYNGGEMKREILDIVRFCDGIPKLEILYAIDLCEDDKGIRIIDDDYIAIGESVEEKFICININNNRIYAQYGEKYLEIAENFSDLIKKFFDVYKHNRIV